MASTPLFPQLNGLLHGGDYNPDQWLDCPDILEKDIELMKKAGINSVSLGIFAWSALEPQEGVYTFEWMDQTIDRLYQNGIFTILATPSGARPAWMDEKYPEVRRVLANGKRNHHGGRHNHCITSPVYRQKVHEMNTLLAKRYGSHPGVILWHLSNEYGGACYCELCRQKFREWLKDRYHNDISELNHAWWTGFWSHTYSSFEQIDPPMEQGERSVLGMILDWRRFTTWNTADFIRNETEPLQKHAPSLPTTTNFMWLFGGLDYNRIAKEIDVISWDAYPRWHNEQPLYEVASETAFNHSLMRSFKRGQPFMLMESTPSLVNWMPYNKLKRPGIHQLACLQAIASGSDTVQYFQFRMGRGSFEQFHGAVVNHTGRDDTRVFREVSQVGSLLKSLSQTAGSAPAPRTAVIYDWDNRWAIEDMAGAAKQDKKYNETCIQHFRAMLRLGEDPDVISSTESFDGYDLIAAPMLYMLKPGVVQRLKEFVSSGGTLVTTWLTGYVDESTLAFLGGFPGDGLMEVTGVEAEELDTLYPGQSNQVLWNGKAYRTAEFCELLTLRGAKTAGTYKEDFYAGQPAVTVHPFGKGMSVHIATRVEENCLMDIYTDIFKEKHLGKGPLPLGLEIHSRVNEGSRFCFYLNFSENPVETPMTSKLCRDMISGVEIPAGTVMKISGYGFLVTMEER